MDDSVSPYVMNEVFLPKGSYPENLVLISQLEGFHKSGGGSRKGVLGGQ